MGKKNKSQVKMAYHQFLIMKELESLAKNKLKQTTSTELAENAYLDSVKEIQNLKEKIKNIQMVLDNLNNQGYAQALQDEFEDMEELTEFLEKQLPKNMTVLNPDEGFKHLLIEKEKIYTHHSDTINKMVNDLKYIWKHFRIPETLKIGDQKSEKTFLDKTRESLVEFQQIEGNDLTDCLPSENPSIKQSIQRTILNYTGISYQYINGASTSNDPVLIRGVRYLFQLLIKNHRNQNQPIVGEKVQTTQVLYRNVPLDEELFKLYKVDQLICFANLTSVSTENISHFGSSPGKVHVIFRIKLQMIGKQLKNKFFSGIDICNLSHYESEKEILVFPFQFFKIKDIVMIEKDKKYEIWIEEEKSKAIIEEIQKPLLPPSKKIKVDSEKLKKNWGKKVKELESGMDEKVAKKQKLKQEFKQQLLKCVEKTTEETATNAEKLTPGLIEAIIGMSLEKMKDQLTQVMKAEKKNHEELEKMVQINKSFDQIYSKFIQMNEDSEQMTKASQQNQMLEPEQVQFKKQIVADQLIYGSIKEEEKNISQEIFKHYEDDLSEKATKFEDLSIETGVELGEKEKRYLVVLMKKGFQKIKKQTILKQSLPPALDEYYMKKLALCDENSLVYRFYCSRVNGVTEKDIKLFVKNEFQKIAEEGDYLKQTCIANGDKISILIESTAKRADLEEIIKKANHENYLKYLSYSSSAQSQNIIYCDAMLARQGNKDYIIQQFGDQIRGNQVYHFPNYTLRVGLKIMGIYGDNQWLTMSNSEGEWPVIYTSLKQVRMNPNLEGQQNCNEYSRNKYPTVSKKSIHCSSEFNELIKFMEPVQINGQEIYMGFQCRVDPGELQFTDQNDTHCFINRAASKSIRPYGIILKINNFGKLKDFEILDMIIFALFSVMNEWDCSLLRVYDQTLICIISLYWSLVCIVALCRGSLEKTWILICLGNIIWRSVLRVSRDKMHLAIVRATLLHIIWALTIDKNCLWILFTKTIETALVLRTISPIEGNPNDQNKNSHKDTNSNIYSIKSARSQRTI